MSARTQYHTEKARQRLTEKKITKTLHSFKVLPYELRDKIWEMALPGTRVVKIYAKDHYHPNHRADSCYYNLKSNNQGVLPSPLMHTCREAREKVLKYYKLVFHATLKNNRAIYIDPQVDILYLHSMEVYFKFVRELETNRYLRQHLPAIPDKRQIARLVIGDGPVCAHMRMLLHNQNTIAPVPSTINLPAMQYDFTYAYSGTERYDRRLRKNAELWAALDGVYFEARRNTWLTAEAEEARELAMTLDFKEALKEVSDAETAQKLKYNRPHLGVVKHEQVKKFGKYERGFTELM